MQAGEAALELLEQDEAVVGDRVAHLDVVFDGHVGDGIRVRFAAHMELGESAFQVRMLRQQLVEFDAVLEGAIHALAVERHDGMRGVADEQGATVDVPLVEAQCRQQASRVAREVLQVLGHQRHRGREFGREEIAHGFHRSQGREARPPLVAEEQGDGEAAVDVRQCDQHVAAAWPDVQRVRFDQESARRGRRNLQFLVTVSEPFDAFAEVGRFHHRGAQSRAGTVGTDDAIEHGLTMHAVAALEAQFAAVEIGRSQRAVEMEACASVLGGLQHAGVQTPAIDRPDHLGIVTAVTHEAVRFADLVHHATAHHHRLIHHRALQTGQAQAVQAAFGQREVDRAPAEIADAARIRTPFEHAHLFAASRQQQGQQAAGQACADQGVFAFRHGGVQCIGIAIITSAIAG